MRCELEFTMLSKPMVFVLVYIALLGAALGGYSDTMAAM
jgi:hypothetical protein